jgi:hypothetical protein
MSRFFSFREMFDRLLRSTTVGGADKRRHRHRVRPSVEALENRLAPAAQFSIATANVIEPGTGGTANMDFTVTRTGDLNSQLTVGYKSTCRRAAPRNHENGHRVAVIVRVVLFWRRSIPSWC